MAEYLIKGGTLIDGTGAPRRQADVLLADGKIKAAGKGLSTRGQTIDATGLLVTPGVIDPHTHMDGQFFFEPRGTSSSWHGITTVLMGHCGYSLAPIKKEHRDYIIHMFARVEEVAPHILENYVPWDWETFPEYMDRMDRGLGINAVTQVGHSTLRYYVMGPEAARRKATQDEIARMRGILHDTFEAGAFGFTTSRAPSQVAWDGTPVPSRYAAPEEVISLAEVLRDFKTGTLGLIPVGLFTGMTDEDKETILTMAKRAGKSIQLNGVGNPAAWEFMRDALKQGVTAYGVQGSQPFYRYFTFAEGTNAFNSTETWWKIMAEMSGEDRLKALADPALRPTLRKESDEEQVMDGKKMRRPRLVWSEVRVARAAKAENKRLEGVSITDLAQREGKHVVDAMLDLAASEGFKTQFVYRFMPEAAWLDKSKGALFNHPNCVPMNTDAGAHLFNECKTGEATYFLKEWVAKVGIMSLEEGVRRVTSMPARLIGIPDRGAIREGMAADVAVFDLDKLEALPKEQAKDLPGGDMRWVQRASGVEHVFVNGQPTILRGKETGELPGRVIRSSWYK